MADILKFPIPELQHRDFIYKSEPFFIGRHAWRVAVFKTGYDGNRVEYHWKRWWDTVDKPDEWHLARSWHSYDARKEGNGLPKSLKRLDKREAPGLKKFTLKRYS